MKALAAALTICCFLVSPIYAQQSSGTVSIELSIQDVLEEAIPYNYGSTVINIGVKDELDPDEELRSVEIVILVNYILYRGTTQTTEIELDKSYVIKDWLGKTLHWSDGENRYDVSLKSFVWKNESIPSNSYFVFEKRNADLRMSLSDLALPRSKYTFTITASSHNTEISFLNIEREIKAAKEHKIVARRSSFYQTLKDEIISKENVLITIILGLTTILLGLLRRRAQALLDSILDKLGTYGSGRLAERRFLKRYIDNIVFNHKYLKLIGFNTVGISRPLLEEVFVSLRVFSNDLHRNLSIKTAPKDEPNEILSIPFARALKENRKLVILGGPGAGKTTTLSYALLVYAQNKSKEVFDLKEDLLPIYIPLRRVSSVGTSIIEDLINKESQILSADILREYPSNYFDRKLREGSCLILLDGLDEVTDERMHIRVAEKINNMVADYPKNRFIVTCRISGWQSLLSGDFKVLQTQDFNRDEIRRFILGWHRAVITQTEYSKLQLNIPDPGKLTERWIEHKEKVVKPAIDIESRRLFRAIDNNNRILAIAVNPMLLSLISLVHYNRRILPKGRTILYSQCIELLIDAWERSKDLVLSLESRITASQKEAVLREIAYEFQVQGKGEDIRENLEELIAKITPRLGIRISARELLQDIETRSGLLIERSINVFGFSHLTLQEYLVAKHIYFNPDLYLVLKSNFDKQEWREVILLYAGLMDDATRLINNIMESDSLDRHILAGYCIGDAQRGDIDTSQTIIARLLLELEHNNDYSDRLINVLSMIAADYIERPSSVEERLSESLISIMVDGKSKQTCINVISTLGKAKITKAIPLLLTSAFENDSFIREAAIKTLISFGDLALLHIEQQISSILSEGQAASASVKLGTLIEILFAIGTGQSAKLLLRIYDFSDMSTHRRVSLAVSQMLENPFIESDLLELPASQLPAGLQGYILDGNSWIYKDVPVKAPFLKVDAKLRSEIFYLISSANRTGTISAEEKGRLQTSSFKIVFPSFIGFLRSENSVELHNEIPEALGYDSSDKDKIAYLAKQVRKNVSLGLDFALRYARPRTERNDSSFEESLSIKWLKAVANLYFILFYCWTLFWAFIWLVTWLSSSADPFPRQREIPITLLASLLFFLLYACLIYFSKQKLKRKILSMQMIGTIVFPFSNFLKILPYFTTINIWLKLMILSLIVAAVCILPFPFTVGMGMDIFYDPIFWAIIIAPTFLFCFFSIMYVKFYVLRENPIYELMLLHPKGRRMIQ